MSATIMGLDLTQKGLSFYSVSDSVPATFFVAMVPHCYASLAGGKSYDLANPRSLQQRLKDDENIDKPTKNRIIRAENASANGIETLGYYAGAVVAANVAGVDASITNALSLGYVAARALYTVTYVALQENRKLAPLRSLIWVVSQGIIATLYFKAASAMSIWPSS
ncbi:hypothetical protein ACHAQH_001689 [Verticillium albo-atrum]